jgi:hypothetical protein
MIKKINDFQAFPAALPTAGDYRAQDILNALEQNAAASQGIQLSGVSASASTASQVAKKGLVFEFSFFWLISAYQNVFIGLLRNAFYTTRPLLILFVRRMIMRMIN